jgi:trehalose 6-phosphate phosphatase
MNYIFHRNGQNALRQYVSSKVLLAFDYDGTLAPITVFADQAVMRPQTRDLMIRLADTYPCIVITGRACADITSHLKSIHLLAILGNHGSEPWQVTKKLAVEIQRWKPILDQRLTGLSGVFVEYKSLSAAVHYRRSSDKKTAKRLILEAIAELGPVRLIPGKQVMNIVPRGAYHKGTALDKAMTRYRCDTAIFIGDDQTDEDAFALNSSRNVLGIRVGSKEKSAAQYCLRSQVEIDRLMRLLLDFAAVDLPRSTAVSHEPSTAPTNGVKRHRKFDVSRRVGKKQSDLALTSIGA